MTQSIAVPILRSMDNSWEEGKRGVGNHLSVASKKNGKERVTNQQKKTVFNSKNAAQEERCHSNKMDSGCQEISTGS